MAAALGAVVALTYAVPAQAATDERDQFQTLVFNQQKLLPRFAQTFTVGKAGQLDKVTLGSIASTSTSVQLSIHTVDASSGLPTNTTLGTPVNLFGPWTCCAAFKEVALAPIPVTVGQRLAIVVDALSGTFTWKNGDTIDAYTGGHAFVGDPWLRGSGFRSEDFAFETWVITATAPPPNQAPRVAADTAAVTVNEGTAPTNTGTFSDPDGDTVTLTASAGSVTKTGSGTWSWNQPASDEAPTQTVTVTANDGHGHTTTASFTVTVNAVAPVARIITDPPSIPEGSPETFTGAATTAWAGDATTLTYSWRVTKNGSAYASGSGTTFTFTPDDDGTYVVTFRATDDSGLFGTDSMTIIGTNVAPTAHITGDTPSSPLVTTSQESITFSGNFTDPGVRDTHAVTWNYGDGTSSAQTSYGAAGSASFSTSHAYASAGTYTVRLLVVDDDGGVGQATTTVTVQTTQQALTSISNYLSRLTGLTDGQRKSLNAKLLAAAAAAARGDRKACNNQLNAFLSELDAYARTGKVSSAEAATLEEAVYTVKGSLGTYNRFLEWWPLAL